MSSPTIIQETISRYAARDLYNWLGSRYDWADFYESKAKEIALDRLELAPGHWVLNAGCGTGKDHSRLLKAVLPGGGAVVLDYSWEMIYLACERNQSPGTLSDITFLPFKDRSFDRLFSSYVLDLMPASKLGGILDEFKRVLTPEGIVVNLSLTEGVSITSKVFIGLWTQVYKISPIACGGCRPVKIYELAQAAGFSSVMWETVEQYGVPSEIVTAIR